jgi:NADH dehydrogenase
MVRKTNIIIVGAGFAGLSALIQLTKSKLNLDIKLFDKDKYFEYTPSLHLYLSNPRYINKIRISLDKYYSDYFINEEIIKVDADKVHTKENSYEFDFLVIATGSTTNFFNNESFKKFSNPVKRIKDIIQINKELEKANSITVVGGGYTGIEIASVLATTTNKKINLIHSKHNLLDSVNEDAGIKSRKYLEDNELTLFLNDRVIGCQDNKITLKSGKELQTDLVIMTAGVRPNDDMLKDQTLNNNLSLKSNLKVFLCGDVAQSETLSTAHNAMIEGRMVAKEIIASINHVSLPKQEKKDWKILAIALGKHNGLITFGKHAIKLPFINFFKWIIEKRIIFEFKNKIQLPI